MKQIDKIKQMNAEGLALVFKNMAITIMLEKMRGNEFDVLAWLESEVEE